MKKIMNPDYYDKLNCEICGKFLCMVNPFDLNSSIFICKECFEKAKEKK